MSQKEGENVLDDLYKQLRSEHEALTAKRATIIESLDDVNADINQTFRTITKLQEAIRVLRTD